MPDRVHLLLERFVNGEVLFQVLRVMLIKAVQLFLACCELYLEVYRRRRLRRQLLLDIADVGDGVITAQQGTCR